MPISKLVKKFNHDQYGEIRVREHKGNIYFLGNDVARSLGYKNTRDAIRTHCKNIIKLDIPHPQSNNKTLAVNFISEPDLYRLTVGSKLPGAEKFEKWVFEEVLPSIRQTGVYNIKDKQDSPEVVLANATLLANNIIEDQKKVISEKESKIKELKPKAEAWQSLVCSDKCVSIHTAAQAFGIKGLGKINMFKLLREKKILQENNKPYQAYINTGRFITKLIDDQHVETQTLITPKGLEWLAGKLVAWGYLLPISVGQEEESKELHIV